jgi:hypothetical protein
VRIKFLRGAQGWAFGAAAGNSRHCRPPSCFAAALSRFSPTRGTGRGDGRDTHAQTCVAADVHSAWIWVPNRFDVEMMADAVTGDVRYLPGCEEEPQSR